MTGSPLGKAKLSFLASTMAGRVAGEQEEEEGGASEGSEDPDGQDRWTQDGACEGVGKEQEKGTAQSAGRKESTMVRSHQHAREMRDDQSDETDRPGQGDGCSRQCRTQKNHLSGRANDGNTEVVGFGFTEQKKVQWTGEEWQGASRGKDKDESDRELVPACAIETAKRPENETPQILAGREGKEREADKGPGKGIDGNADEQQRGDRGASAHRGETIDQRSCEKGPDQRTGGNRKAFDPPWKGSRNAKAQNACDRPHRPSARHSNQSGIREGVAEQSLDGGSCHGKAGSGRDRE